MEKNKKYSILIVDDDSDIRELLYYNLEKEGYKINLSSSGTDAAAKLNDKFDLIILDIMMPGINGYDLCKIIRSKENLNSNVPIIFLTAKDSEFDEILGLELGADDYIVKPISIKKLIARIRSALRRNYIDDKEIIQFGKLKINSSNRQVMLGNSIIPLTKIEFDILYLLSSKSDKVMRRTEILENIKENNEIVIDRVVDVHIKKIRDKLGTYKNIIETVHGMGYIVRKGAISE